MKKGYDCIAVGERLQRRRKALGLSIKVTAGRIGKAETYYAGIEKGSNGMSVGTMMALADVLDMSMDSIIYGKDFWEQTEADFNCEENIDWPAMLDSMDENRRKNVKELVERFIGCMEGS